LRKKKRGGEYWTKFYPPPIPFTHSPTIAPSTSLHQCLRNHAEACLANNSEVGSKTNNVCWEAIKNSRDIVSVLVKKEIFTKPVMADLRRVRAEQTKITVTTIAEGGKSVPLEFYSLAFEVKTKGPKEKG